MSTLNDNLISYWKLDETSGNAVDSVGTNTLTNTGVTFAGGLLNNCAVFDANTDVLVGSKVTPTSISFWYKWTTPATSVVFFANTTPDNSFQTAAGATTWLIWDNTSNRSFATTAKTNVWTHIVLTWTGSGYSLYENGVFKETVTSNQISFDKIGRSGGSPTTAQIDEFALWSRVLTAGEIELLYNRGFGKQAPFFFRNAQFYNPS